MEERIDAILFLEKYILLFFLVNLHAIMHVNGGGKGMEIKEYVAKRKEQLKNLVMQCEKKPHLAIVQMNDDAASHAYVRGKLKDCEEVGIVGELIRVPLEETEEQLCARLEQLNQRDDIDGYIVQMPLPRHIHEERIKRIVDPQKDVDGFHPCSLYQPCTPKGVIDYLKHEKISFRGKNAVVLGRSYIVGRPLAKMLLDLDTNCVVLHTKTTEEDKKRYLEQADLIFSAVGKPGILDERYHYREDAVIVDIGISRVDGHLCGDAKPNLPVFLQTPVPGGVGLLTRLTLLWNVWEAYQHGIHN